MTSPSKVHLRQPKVRIRRAAPSELGALQALDTAACVLFDAIGLHVNLPGNHPFVLAETERWQAALSCARVFVALIDGDELTGFAVLGSQDGAAYLDQLSVHPRHMRRGIGSALLTEVFESVGVSPLWLTTYAHVAWNGPYYAKFGFRPVPDAACGEELQRTLAEQRAALPYPEQRIAMLRQDPRF